MLYRILSLPFELLHHVFMTVFSLRMGHANKTVKAASFEGSSGKTTKTAHKSKSSSHSADSSSSSECAESICSSISSQSSSQYSSYSNRKHRKHGKHGCRESQLQREQTHVRILMKRCEALNEKLKLLSDEVWREREARFVVEKCYIEKMRKYEIEVDFRENEIQELRERLRKFENMYGSEEEPGSHHQNYHFRNSHSLDAITEEGGTSPCDYYSLHRWDCSAEPSFPEQISSSDDEGDHIADGEGGMFLSPRDDSSPVSPASSSCSTSSSGSLHLQHSVSPFIVAAVHRLTQSYTDKCSVTTLMLDLDDLALKYDAGANDCLKACVWAILRFAEKRGWLWSHLANGSTTKPLVNGMTTPKSQDSIGVASDDSKASHALNNSSSSSTLSSSMIRTQQTTDLESLLATYAGLFANFTQEMDDQVDILAATVEFFISRHHNRTHNEDSEQSDTLVEEQLNDKRPPSTLETGRDFMRVVKTLYKVEVIDPAGVKSWWHGLDVETDVDDEDSDNDVSVYKEATRGFVEWLESMEDEEDETDVEESDIEESSEEEEIVAMIEEVDVEQHKDETVVNGQNGESRLSSPSPKPKNSLDSPKSSDQTHQHANGKNIQNDEEETRRCSTDCGICNTLDSEVTTVSSVADTTKQLTAESEDLNNGEVSIANTKPSITNSPPRPPLSLQSDTTSSSTSAAPTSLSSSLSHTHHHTTAHATRTFNDVSMFREDSLSSSTSSLGRKRVTFGEQDKIATFEYIIDDSSDESECECDINHCVCQSDCQCGCSHCRCGDAVEGVERGQLSSKTDHIVANGNDAKLPNGNGVSKNIETQKDNKT